jgi:hypothetical protein
MATRPALATDVETVEPAALEPLLDDRQERTLKALVIAWLVALTWFWSWWLQPEHWADPTGMVFNSAMLAWATGLAGYLFFFALRATRPSTVTPLPAVRVAMVVTKAPSEPWKVVQRTLEAMLAQELAIPFQVWLADERPTAETLRWCETHGVRVSSRHGVAAYHHASWPRRTRSKEGSSGAKLLPIRFVAPTLVWPALTALVLAATDVGRTSGYRLLAMGSMLVYLVAANAAVALHLRDNRRRRRSSPPPPRRPPAAWLAQGGTALVATLTVTAACVTLLAWRARHG